MERLLISLLAIVIAAQTVTSQRTYAIIAGRNSIGQDILYWNGSFAGCAARCDATPGCIAYVLDKPVGANCWLKYQLLTVLINASFDTYYVTNQAAFKIRLAVKDEVGT